MNVKNKIYLITEYYHSNQNTTGYLLGKLYCFFNKQDDIDLVLIAKEDKSCPKYENGHYVSAPQLDKKNLVKRFLYELIIVLKFFFEIIQHVKRGSTVFTGTTPIFLLSVIFLTKKIIGYKWVLLVHDVFPENLVAAKVLQQDSIPYKIIKYFFDKIYASADQVIVIGRDMKSLVYSKTKKDNIHVVQNWIDFEDIEIQKKSDNPILKSLGWCNDETIIFQFFGNIGRVQGVDIVCKAIKKMKYSERAKFLFIGDGAYVSHLKEQIQNLGMNNIVYWGSLEQDQKSIGLNACDVALVTLTEGMLGLGVPSKSYFTMAANKPILAVMEKQAEVSEMVLEHQIGWNVAPNDELVLAEKMDEIILNFKEHSLNSSRDVLIDNYSEKVAMHKILKIVNDLNLSGK